MAEWTPIKVQGERREGWNQPLWKTADGRQFAPFKELDDGFFAPDPIRDGDPVHYQGEVFGTFGGDITKPGGWYVDVPATKQLGPRSQEYMRKLRERPGYSRVKTPGFHAVIDGQGNLLGYTTWGPGVWRDEDGREHAFIRAAPAEVWQWSHTAAVTQIRSAEPEDLVEPDVVVEA